MLYVYQKGTGFKKIKMSTDTNRHSSEHGRRVQTSGRYSSTQNSRRDYQKIYLQNRSRQNTSARVSPLEESPVVKQVQANDAEIVKVRVLPAVESVSTEQPKQVVTSSAVSASVVKPAKRRAKTRKHKKPKEDVKKPIAHHISELRQRLIWCVLALVAGGIIGYKYQQQIINWLVKPLQQQLFYTSPAGGFDFLIKICLFFGFLVAVPVIVYNFMRYISPALPKSAAFKTSRVIIVSILLALAGIAFAYYVSLPAALHFLSQFTTDQIQSLISAQEYFNFVMIYLAGFALLFQMPLIVAMINKITPLTPMMLMKKQRIVILVSFVIAAILTPTPDPINQALMAFPIIGLYQTSVGVVWQDNKRSKRRAKKSGSIGLDQQQTAAA